MMPSQIRTKILVVFFIISTISLIGYLILYFQFWDQSQLTDQLIEQQQPIALGWVQLMSGINHSLAAQRGWVFFGTDSFKQERLHAWQNEINPNLEQLKTLYQHYESQRPVEVRLVFDIRLALLDLAKFQEAIEKIAQTPENIPAQQLFTEKLKPAFETMNKNLGVLVEEERGHTSKSQKMIQILTELRGTAWSSIANLHDYLLNGEQDAWEAFRENWGNNERFLLDAQALDLPFTETQQSHFRQFLQNRETVAALAGELFQMRNQEAWNQARYIMETQTIPLVRRIEEAINRVVAFQSDFAKTNNRALQEQFEQWRILLLSVALGTFVMGFVLLILLGRKVMVPLQELRDAVRSVKDDDFYGQIEVTTQDEVGELAQEFGEMLIEIRGRTKERQELVVRLETEKRSQQKNMEQLEEQNKKLVSQRELDQAQTTIAKVINSLDIAAILEAGLETLVKTTNSQLGILYLAKTENDVAPHQLELKHYYTVDESVMADEVYQVHGLPAQIFQTQKPSVIRDPAQQGRSFHLGAVANYPTMIAGYPLVFQDRCLGVLLLASIAPFDEAMLRFIENSVPQLAVSIQNATTFQTLQIANLELKAATQLKSEFLASMSHELRTPLNAIIGFAGTLLDVDEENRLNDYQQDRLSRVHQSGKHLLELINSILDLSKIEARKMPVNVLSFNLKDLLREVIGLMEALVANKPIELSLEIEEGVESCVSDQEKIRQIMINLLGNAVKFTSTGSISVVTYACDDQLRIDVKDTGCGIPGAQLERIFETFRQVDGSETRNYEGSGLGLALVRSMSRLLGGDVSVTSTEDEGSTFSVTLPIPFQASAPQMRGR